MNADLEVIEHQAPATLFGSDDPTKVIEKASKIADALKDVIVKKKLVATISGKQHVLVDGWTLCGTMLGVFPVVVRTTELYQDEKSIGFEAYTEARTITGAIVGAATARCTRTEGTWKSRADYALLSMAQTRSVSKAMRIPLGFIISMAGYETSPAEEVMDLQEPRQTPSVAPQSTQAPEDEGQGVLAQLPEELANKALMIASRKKIRENYKQHPKVVDGSIKDMTWAELQEEWPEETR